MPLTIFSFVCEQKSNKKCPVTPFSAASGEREAMKDNAHRVSGKSKTFRNLMKLIDS